MNKKLLLVTIPIIVVIIAALGVLSYLLLAEPSSEDIYLENIRIAHRYLDSGEVDQAILYFKNAINEDDTKEESYLELAKVYFEKQNDVKSALDILFEGYGKTNSSLIMERIEYYLPFADENGTAADTPDNNEATHKGIINSAYMDIFSTYTYESYTNQYTLKTESSTGDAFLVSYVQFEAEFEYKNTNEQPDIVNTNNGKPYDGVRPTAIKITDYNIMFTGAESGLTTEDLTKSGAQNLIINKPNAEIQTYYASFAYRGCLFCVECDENGNINFNGFNKIVPPAADFSTSTELKGTVLNADDNSLVKNATLDFREGKGKRTGNIVKSVSAPDGSYSVELDAGDYTVEVKAEGFITEFFDAHIPDGGGEISLSFVVSPELKANQMRFVVEWTNTQYDLYIHIKGTSSEGEALQYWEYGYKTANVSDNIGDTKTGTQNGARFTSATITDSKGSYEFHVHGGKDQYNKQYLYNADVVVKIYKDNHSDPTVVKLPDSIPLQYWVVCQVHDGAVKMVD